MASTTVPGATSLQLHRGADALALLCSPPFQRQWSALLDACPWGTSMQYPEFVIPWYSSYEDVYEPLTIHQFAPDGDLSGLLLLAVNKAAGSIACAGTHHAEYQAWLATPGDQRFIGSALKKLCDLGFDRLQFRYIPSGAPLTWLKEGKHRWDRRSDLRAVRKPLMQLDSPAEIQKSLKKKSNKSRINRLQRDGALEFHQLGEPQELDQVAEDLVLFTDFRQGALHGSCPFRDDKRKYSFYRKLMHSPKLLHVTVMRAGQKLVSAHVGMANRREVSLGILAHSPIAAEHSPGKIHLLYLGLLLSQQGFAALDLTPGGDPYKDRFATHYDEAHLLTVFLSRDAWLRHLALSGCIAAGKRIAKYVHVNPQELITKLAAVKYKVRRDGFVRSSKSLLCSAVRCLWTRTEIRFYRMPAFEARQRVRDDSVRESSLADLLCYEPVEAWQPSKQAFLNEAMSRIEKGVRVYSCSVDGVLAQYGWATIGPGKAYVPEVHCDFEYPPKSAVLSDHYTHPTFRGRGLGASCLARMLHDIGGIEDLEYVYASVRADDAEVRSIVENAGFQFQACIVRRKRFGSTQVVFTGNLGHSPTAHTEPT